MKTQSAAKAETQSLLQRLPDDCTFEDIHYHLYVLEKIRKGLDAVDQQGGLSQEEMEERLKKWTIA